MAPDSVALLLGARLVTRSNDTEYPFRQDSDFWYLTGFDHPEAAAVLRNDGGPEYTLYVQPRERAAEIWNGFRPGVEGAVSDYGASEARPIAELMAAISELAHASRRIYHCMGRDPAIDGALTSALDTLRRRSRSGSPPASEIVDPREITHEMRLFKSEDEAVIMRRAAEISHEAHSAAAALAHEGHNEFELEAALDYTFRRLGGAGPAYSSIVGGGSNATVLHYIANDQPLVNGELLLIDAGVEYQGYASDVTRTYPIGGRFTRERRELYEAVLRAQEVGLEACRPGTTLDEIHATTLRVLVDGMVQLGLLSGVVDELIQKSAFQNYYMHRTSHWLGLDVHDAGIYAPEGTPRKLEPGMCFTIEPGIYVPADDESAPEALRGVGVRIEDDVLITPDGHENLTASIPKQVSDLEALVGAGTL